jgi:putative redox protein
MAEQYEVTVTLTNSKVQFTGKARNNPEVVCDYFPPFGDGQGYTGLELLLMSLAVCSGTSMAGLLRKFGKSITGLRINARGILKEEHPKAFSKIFLEFILNSKDATDEDIQKALQKSEEKICPVWSMLKNNVEIVTEFKNIS